MELAHAYRYLFKLELCIEYRQNELLALGGSLAFTLKAVLY